MTRAEIAADARVHRERQEARSGRDAIALNDHGAVVQRRAWLKDARQQVVGDHRVERDAALDVVAKADLPLEDDDGAGAARGEVGRGGHQLLDRFIRVLGALEVAEERRAAEVRERTPDVGLEQHDDREDHVGGEVSNDPVDGLELQPLREEIEQQDEAGAERHLRRARAADQQQQLVHENRDDADVQRVGPADVRTLQKRGEPVHESTR